MNWRLSALDRFQLISNSDAHSPAKLGREANLLSSDLSYEGLKMAVETGTGWRERSSSSRRKGNIILMDTESVIFV